MKSALLIIDMQNAFSQMVTTTLPKVLILANHFQSHNLPILLTQHGHPPSDLTPPLTNQLVKHWTPKGSIHVNTPSWTLLPQIQNAIPTPTKLIHKNVYDAFINTCLEEELHELGVERVVICGVMTDCCCDSTARSAFNRGFETWLVGDACASRTVVQHDRALESFAFGYGPVRGVDEVLEILE